MAEALAPPIMSRIWYGQSREWRARVTIQGIFFIHTKAPLMFLTVQSKTKCKKSKILIARLIHVRSTCPPLDRCSAESLCRSLGFIVRSWFLMPYNSKSLLITLLIVQSHNNFFTLLTNYSYIRFFFFLRVFNHPHNGT